MILLIANSKGGVGKSTLATNRGIYAVTLSRFTGKKGADISPQNNFLDDSLTPHLTTLGAKYRKTHRRLFLGDSPPLAGAIGLCCVTPQYEFNPFAESA